MHFFYLWILYHPYSSNNSKKVIIITTTTTITRRRKFCCCCCFCKTPLPPQLLWGFLLLFFLIICFTFSLLSFFFCSSPFLNLFLFSILSPFSKLPSPYSHFSLSLSLTPEACFLLHFTLLYKMRKTMGIWGCGVTRLHSLTELRPCVLC